MAALLMVSFFIGALAIPCLQSENARTVRIAKSAVLFTFMWFLYAIAMAALMIDDTLRQILHLLEV